MTEMERRGIVATCATSPQTTRAPFAWKDSTPRKYLIDVNDSKLYYPLLGEVIVKTDGQSQVELEFDNDDPLADQKVRDKISEKEATLKQLEVRYSEGLASLLDIIEARLEIVLAKKSLVKNQSPSLKEPVEKEIVEILKTKYLMQKRRYEEALIPSEKMIQARNALSTARNELERTRLSQLINFEKEEQTKYPWGNQNGDFKARILYTRNQWSSGEVPIVALEITSTSKKPYTIQRNPFSCEVEVDGMKYQYREEKLLGGLAEETTRTIWYLTLNQDWRMDDKPLIFEPGEHQLTIHTPIGKTTVSSNTVQLTINEAPPHKPER